MTFSTLICDEAHRTAGLSLKRSRKKASTSSEGKSANDLEREENERRLREFALCHDQEAFPAKYRVYQTATPRVYDVTTKKADFKADDGTEWIVRSMDDPSIFGVKLFERSYKDAVENEWLSDYRIIAFGVNDEDLYNEATQLALANPGKGRHKLTTPDVLRGLGLAMVMGGLTQRLAERSTEEGDDDVVDDTDAIVVNSCIAFMNTVNKSKMMAKILPTDATRQFLNGWLEGHAEDGTVPEYTVEHVDATSNVTEREAAKANLKHASAGNRDPHAVVNVGIFGEGTDSPSLSAVSFLEPRKSPVDVIQAVGRAMRKSPDKKYGYIVVPLVIPTDVAPETWLATAPEDDWKVLGQVLRALRAHDTRIEDSLKSLLKVYLPRPPAKETALVLYGDEDGVLKVVEHVGSPGTAEVDAWRLVNDEDDLSGTVRPIDTEALKQDEYPTGKAGEPVKVVSAVKPKAGETEVRRDAPVRNEAKKGEVQGTVNAKNTVEHGEKMANRTTGRRVPASEIERKRRQRQKAEQGAHHQLSLLLKDGVRLEAVCMNLLERSGLTSNRVERDLNLLRRGVYEAARHLKEDELQSVLDDHFGLTNLPPPKPGKPRADGVTIAALLLMNAAMLHQRIAKGRWLTGIKELTALESDTNLVRQIARQWDDITREDFEAVLMPAIEVIRVIEDTNKTVGLERALRHIASEAARIAEAYADMGADHAGALFNRVMGDQSSDGAFFTRPTAGSLLARLALDAADVDDTDWTKTATWDEHKVVDLACGSGTLLQAALADMKRRAREQGADDTQLAKLHRLAVESTLKGFDINAVSLQLAASRLTAGNQDITFRQMGLHKMEYGPDRHSPNQVHAGSLELLSQTKIVLPQEGTAQRSLEGVQEDTDPDVTSEQMRMSDAHDPEDRELEDAVAAASRARIVIMNPPFTKRQRMGEKFADDDRDELRGRVDALSTWMLGLDPDARGFGEKGSIGPMFHALADKCANPATGVLALVGPTISFSSPSNLKWRKELARRFHVHTMVTCHDPADSHMAEGTKGEQHSLLVLARKVGGSSSPTCKIALDRFPHNEDEVQELHVAILAGHGNTDGTLADGWGEVSYWPAERSRDGDWTAGIWRSPELAEAGQAFASDNDLMALKTQGLEPKQMGMHGTAGYHESTKDEDGSFPVVAGSGTEAQTTISAQLTAYWIHRASVSQRIYSTDDSVLHPLKAKAGRLFITFGQSAASGRLTALASEHAYVGRNWMPASGVEARHAKAVAVFVNSTPGRVQLMRHVGRSLTWPQYIESGVRAVCVPSLENDDAVNTLAACWETTKDMEVPRYDEGECEVRQMWDEAVSDAMGGKDIWSKKNLERLRKLLHREPHVCGKPYGHYST